MARASALAELEHAELVARAQAGSPAAWEELVRRFAPLVTSVVRGCGVRPADVADVAQTVWLRLFEHLPRLRQPERVAGWVVITARRESWRTQQRSGRAVPVEAVDEAATGTPDPADELVAAERRGAVQRAVGRLSARHRRMLDVLVWQETPYADAARELGVPVGSLGPTRQRCLRTLAGIPELAALA